MRILVRAGAKVEENRFSISLREAAVYGHPKAVRFLLAHGADPDAKGTDGLSVREALVAIGNRRMAALLPKQRATAGKKGP